MINKGIKNNLFAQLKNFFFAVNVWNKRNSVKVHEKNKNLEYYEKINQVKNQENSFCLG